MDIVDYTDESARPIKRMQHLSDWKLILQLFLIIPLHISCEGCKNDTVVTYIGDTASIARDCEVHSFFVIEWYFGETKIAEAPEDILSRDSLNITEHYKFRFLLQEDNSVGFNLTNVTETDTGEYTCIVALKHKGILELKQKLRVIARNTHDTSTTISGPGERTTIPTPTPTGDTSRIVLGVLIPFVVIALLLGVLGFLYWRRKKRNSNQITRDSEASTPMT